MKKSDDNFVPQAVEKGRGTLWLVWLIPFVALTMAGWMIYKYYAERGVDIVVTYDSGNGIEAGKTPLVYKGIKIGVVSDIAVDRNDLSKINVTITVDRRAAPAVMRKGNSFVKVSPKITLTEVSGLDTILSGVYIEVFPAVPDRNALLKLPVMQHFVGMDTIPAQYNGTGVYVTLKSKTGDLTVGTPVLYKKFVVGKIIKKVLDGNGLRYIAHIDHDYAWLVKEDSHFWKMSALEVKASLAQIKVSFDSLATLLTGGVSFDSPEDSPRIKHKRTVRELYDSRADVLLDRENIVLMLASNSSLRAGLSKVYYRGNEAGRVVDVRYLPKRDETKVTVRLSKSFKPLANAKAHFWIVEPKVTFQGIQGIDALTRGTYVAFDTADPFAAPKKRFVLHKDSAPVVGTTVHLKIDEAMGIREGTPVYYRDIQVGSVSKAGLDPKSGKLDVQAVVESRYAGLLNDTTMFYNRSGMEAKLSLHEAYVRSGTVASLIAGGIAFETLRFDAPSKQRTFKLYKGYEAYKKARYLSGKGRKIKLYVPELGSLSEGAPVLYKKMKAGEIMDVRYDAKADRFELTLFVAAPFSDKINASTRFVEASGLKVDVAFPQITLETGSLESILRGGVAFVTPAAEAKKDDGTFELYDAKRTNYTRFTLLMEQGYGLKKGSPLLYKGLPVGKVDALALKNGHVEATVLIEKAHADLLDADSWFWLETFHAGIDGVENVSAAISGPAIALRPGLAGKRSDTFALRSNPPAPTYGKAGLRIRLYADRKSSLKVGSPLLYRQVQIGQVESWQLSGDGTAVELTVYVEPQYAHMVRANAKFYNATAFGMEVNLAGVKVKTETLETMIHGGISMAVPDEPGDKVENMSSFLLYNSPQQEWLAWRPKL